MARKIHKLKGFQPEQFRVICIASHQNHYRLSWALNKLLNIQLQRSDDLTINIPKANIVQHFSVYSYRQDDAVLSYDLIGNKSEQGVLFKEMPNIDYLFKISGEKSDAEFTDLIKRVNSLEIVITAFEPKPLTNVQSKKINF